MTTTQLYEPDQNWLSYNRDPSYQCWNHIATDHLNLHLHPRPHHLRSRSQHLCPQTHHFHHYSNKDDNPRLPAKDIFVFSEQETRERGRERPRGGVQAPHGKHARWQLYCGVARAQGQNTLRLRGDYGKVKTQLVAEYYEELTKKPTDNKTLIAILASCGALLIMIVILAVCASHHRKPYGENQQHLTEELQTVENGYHDNPTLEVMEVQPEMQEKKMALNGEFNDSWIVPMDNLMKEDMPDEEDTHL
eukprot:XP_011618012.1 PREDICTED: podocalyxin [Takifugu rubripes]